MAGANVAAISNVLKYRYLGPIQEQLNNDVLVTQILDLNSKNIDLDGLKAVVPLHTARNSGVGARREDETLPTAGAQAYAAAQYDLAYLYGTARFTGQAIQKTKTDAGAFLRVITSELDGLRNDLTLDSARQFYGDGTGVIATAASLSGQVITLQSAEALDKGFLGVGMTIDIGSIANPTLRNAAVAIVDVNPATPSITITGAGAIVNNDVIFRASNADATGSKEVDAGLQKLVSTSANTVGGINAAGAGNAYWDNLRDTTGGAISLSNLMLNWNKSLSKGAKQGNVVAVTTPGILRRLFATTDFTSNVRFVDTQDLVGGFSSLAFQAGSSKVTMVGDRLAPYGKVYFADKDKIKVYSPGDWDYLQRDGLTIRWDANKDAYLAVLFRYVNLGISQRSTSLVMSGLTDTGF
jgi:hypothetical protein